jgi:repressor LexA
MEPLGPKLRRQRRRLGFTLDELAGKTAISKPYLSLIETGRVKSPPSDEKLRRLEQVLGFKTGELVSQAHLQRTPGDVRAMLQSFMKEGSGLRVQGSGEQELELSTPFGSAFGSDAQARREPQGRREHSALSTSLQVLHELIDRSAGNVEQVRTNAVPVINRISAGYPKDFTDLSYPKGVADDYVGCPDLHDGDAFAARVYGDSMTPKYREGDIVIFSPAAAPRDGDDCFVRFADGQTTFKRVFFETGDAGKPVLRLQPRNEKYRPQVMPADAVSGLYRAVYRYQRVDQD